jgi:hypothetical protein
VGHWDAEEKSSWRPGREHSLEVPRAQVAVGTQSLCLEVSLPRGEGTDGGQV